MNKMKLRSNDIKNRQHKHLIKKNTNLLNENRTLKQNFDDQNEKINGKMKDSNDFVDILNSTVLKNDFEFDYFKDDAYFDNLSDFI